MNLFWYLWLLNVLLVIDCAINKRNLTWFFILTLGPVGALAYLVYFFESITFPFPVARAWRAITQKKVLKPCPRCGVVSEIKAHQDGRQLHYMCEVCIQKTFSGESEVEAVVQAAEAIVQEPPMEALPAPKAPEPEPESGSQEIELWGQTLKVVDLPEDIGKAIQRVIKLETRFGYEQGQRSLHKVGFLEGECFFPTRVSNDQLVELFNVSADFLPNCMKGLALGEGWGVEGLRNHVKALDIDRAAEWLRHHVLEEFGEKNEDGAVEATKKSKRYHKERDKLLEVCIDYLLSELEDPVAVYAVTPRHSPFSVFFLTGGCTGIFWVTAAPD